MNLKFSKNEKFLCYFQFQSKYCCETNVSCIAKVSYCKVTNFKSIYPEEVVKNGMPSLVVSMLILFGGCLCIVNEAADLQWGIIAKWNCKVKKNTASN